MCSLAGRRAEARLVHHLFGVVGPAFGEGVADEELADFGLRAVGVQELQEVAGLHFVHRREEQARLGRGRRRRALPSVQVGSGGAM